MLGLGHQTSRKASLLVWTGVAVNEFMKVIGNGVALDIAAGLNFFITFDKREIEPRRHLWRHHNHELRAILRDIHNPTLSVRIALKYEPCRQVSNPADLSLDMIGWFRHRQTVRRHSLRK